MEYFLDALLITKKFDPSPAHEADEELLMRSHVVEEDTTGTHPWQSDGASSLPPSPPLAPSDPTGLLPGLSAGAFHLPHRTTVPAIDLNGHEPAPWSHKTARTIEGHPDHIVPLPPMGPLPAISGDFQGRHSPVLHTANKPTAKTYFAPTRDLEGKYILVYLSPVEALRPTEAPAPTQPLPRSGVVGKAATPVEGAGQRVSGTMISPRPLSGSTNMASFSAFSPRPTCTSPNHEATPPRAQGAARRAPHNNRDVELAERTRAKLLAYYYALLQQLKKEGSTSGTEASTPVAVLEVHYRAHSHTTTAAVGTSEAAPPLPLLSSAVPTTPAAEGKAGIGGSPSLRPSIPPTSITPLGLSHLRSRGTSGTTPRGMASESSPGCSISPQSPHPASHVDGVDGTDQVELRSMSSSSPAGTNRLTAHSWEQLHQLMFSRDGSALSRVEDLVFDDDVVRHNPFYGGWYVVESRTAYLRWLQAMDGSGTWPSVLLLGPTGSIVVMDALSCIEEELAQHAVWRKTALGEEGPPQGGALGMMSSAADGGLRCSGFSPNPSEPRGAVDQVVLNSSGSFPLVMEANSAGPTTSSSRYPQMSQEGGSQHEAAESSASLRAGPPELSTPRRSTLIPEEAHGTSQSQPNGDGRGPSSSFVNDPQLPTAEPTPMKLPSTARFTDPVSMPPTQTAAAVPETCDSPPRAAGDALRGRPPAGAPPQPHLSDPLAGGDEMENGSRTPHLMRGDCPSESRASSTTPTSLAFSTAFPWFHRGHSATGTQCEDVAGCPLGALLREAMMQTTSVGRQLADLDRCGTRPDEDAAPLDPDCTRIGDGEEDEMMVDASAPSLVAFLFSVGWHPRHSQTVRALASDRRRSSGMSELQFPAMDRFSGLSPMGDGDEDAHLSQPDVGALRRGSSTPHWASLTAPLIDGSAPDAPPTPRRGAQPSPMSVVYVSADQDEDELRTALKEMPASWRVLAATKTIMGEAEDAAGANSDFFTRLRHAIHVNAFPRVVLASRSRNEDGDEVWAIEDAHADADHLVRTTQEEESSVVQHLRGPRLAKAIHSCAELPLFPVCGMKEAMRSDLMRRGGHYVVLCASGPVSARLHRLCTAVLEEARQWLYTELATMRNQVSEVHLLLHPNLLHGDGEAEQSLGSTRVVRRGGSTVLAATTTTSVSAASPRSTTGHHSPQYFSRMSFETYASEEHSLSAQRATFPSVYFLDAVPTEVQDALLPAHKIEMHLQANTEELREDHAAALEMIQEHVTANILEHGEELLPSREGELYLACVRLPQRQAVVLRRENHNTNAGKLDGTTISATMVMSDTLMAESSSSAPTQAHSAAGQSTTVKGPSGFPSADEVMMADNSPRSAGDASATSITSMDALPSMMEEAGPCGSLTRVREFLMEHVLLQHPNSPHMI